MKFSMQGKHGKLPVGFAETLQMVRTDWRKLTAYPTIYTRFSKKHYVMKFYVLNSATAKEAQIVAKEFGFESEIQQTYRGYDCIIKVKLLPLKTPIQI